MAESSSQSSWKKNLLMVAGGTTLGLGIAAWRYFASENATNDGGWGGSIESMAPHVM
jgi:hypothetical protein